MCGESAFLGLELNGAVGAKASAAIGPKARLHISLGQRPSMGIQVDGHIAESAIQPLIPTHSVRRIRAMFAKELAVLVLKCTAAMMFLLLRDVFQRGIQLTWTHRKSSVAALPVQFAILTRELLDPFRRFLLQPFYHLGLRETPGRVVIR